MNFSVSLEDDIESTEVIELYRANGWSSAEKPWIYAGNEH